MTSCGHPLTPLPCALQLLGDDAVLAVPTAPGPAPRIDSPPEEAASMRTQLLQLTCIAGLAGLPQVGQL